MFPERIVYKYLLAQVITEIVTESTIGTQALPGGHVELADNPRLLLSKRCRRTVDRLSNQDIFGFLQ